jgi:hypothetical protein
MNEGIFKAGIKRQGNWQVIKPRNPFPQVNAHPQNKPPRNALRA